MGAVVGLALFNVLVSRAFWFLISLVLASPIGGLFRPLVALGSLVSLIIGSVGGVLLGYYASTAFDVERALPTVTLFVLTLAFVGSAGGVILINLVAPSGMSLPESIVSRVVIYSMTALGVATVLTVGVVGGAALARL